MKTRPVEEKAKFWRPQDLDRLELLRATYITHSFPPHYHKGFGFGIIERGCLVYYYGGTKRIISAGSVVMINPTEVHSGHAADEMGWTYRILYPECSLLEQAMLEVTDKQESTPYFPTPAIQDRAIAQQVLRLHIALEKSAIRLKRESYLISTLAQLIIRYAQDRPVLQPVGREKRAVMQAREYIDAHYAKNISLEELAHVASLRPLRFLRVFRKEVGLPPHAYLVHVRAANAKKLLALGLPIAQAAFETGFTDQSHFTRHFKRLVGITPGQYVLGCKNVQDRLN